MTHAKHWQLLFRESQVSSAQYSQVLMTMIKELLQKIKLTGEQFLSEYGESPILDRLEKLYHTQSLRLLDGFKTN